MKVVILCGGMGTRLREHSDTIPKPLVPIGSRPIIWHLMKYYAHFGHTDFILCLGYKGDQIREYFLNYDPNLSRDFLMEGNSKRFFPADSDIDEWTIQFVDTGLHSNIGQRLARVRPFVGDDEMFLVNYSDQLSDLPLDKHIDRFERTDSIAGFLAVRPSQSFHIVKIGDGHKVSSVEPVEKSDIWINGGYLIFRSAIFDYLRSGEELVEQPFARLLKEDRLFAYKYEGFWKAMDTFKDKIEFDRLSSSEDRPWQVWRNARS